MTITLYSLAGADVSRPFSPHCWKIVMALHHKGLAFQEKPLPFTGIAAAEEGFSNTVPLLKDGDHLVADSFKIALYLEEAYPERPSLFGGEGGIATARFVEGFSQTVLHPVITRIAVGDIHAMLAPADQAYFRESREKRLGQTLEQLASSREAHVRDLPGLLTPLRHMLASQNFIGGKHPIFADYIVFGALQWLRITTGLLPLPESDPVRVWFESLLDLHDGAGRAVA
ncbi:glutathione S-transferase family protein [Allorhizobium undicola]|uniref:glutathione S-transferase family protein n=1 Tax=Allorhizobium undicola TaxID=78527 RepID=UPI000480BC90|nr:glutathione S-transferase family protein [Allorhizobium undicola]